jgi:hypothetical protein
VAGDVRIIKKFTPDFQGYIRYSQTKVDYDGIEEEDKTYNPSIGFDYSIIDDTSLSFDIGYFINDFESREDQSGLTLNGRLVKFLKHGYRTGSLILSVLAGQEYSTWSAQNLNYEKYYEAAGTVTYQLTRLLSGTLFSSYRHSEYPDETPKRTDKTTRAGIGLAVQVFPWMSLGLNYDYRIVDSTVKVNRYEVNRIILGITLSPSRPYRSGHY